MNDIALSSLSKVSDAISQALGKTIEHVFLAQNPRLFRIVLVFSDDTYYEFYGAGTLNGARDLDRGEAAFVRGWLAGDREGTLVEVPRPSIARAPRG